MEKYKKVSVGDIRVINASDGQIREKHTVDTAKVINRYRREVVDENNKRISMEKIIVLPIEKALKEGRKVGSTMTTYKTQINNLKRLFEETYPGMELPDDFKL